MQQATLLRFFQPSANGEIDQTKRSNTAPQEEIGSADSSAVVLPQSPVVAGVVGPLANFLSEQSKRSHGIFIPKQCPEVVIVNVQPTHITHLKQVTATLLPVKYPDKFFSECISDQQIAQICRVLVHKSKPIGWIRCRFQTGADTTDQLYIQAIGVLAPWRGQGLASDLLECVVKAEALQQNHIQIASAHVWENNQNALEWYEKRGFKRTQFEVNYYRRLRPAGAWVMQKQLT